MPDKKYVFVIQRPVVTYEQICVKAPSEWEALKIAEDDVLWDDAIPDADNYEVLYDQVKVIDKEQCYD